MSTLKGVFVFPTKLVVEPRTCNEALMGPKRVHCEPKAIYAMSRGIFAGSSIQLDGALHNHEAIEGART